MSTLEERIQAADDFTRELVDVPEWGEKIEVRSLSLEEKSAIALQHVDEIDLGKMMLDLVIRCSFNPETGERVFSDGASEWLGKKNSAAVERLLDAVHRMVGTGQAEVDAAGKG